jgi:CHAT domain-containing protein
MSPAIALRAAEQWLRGAHASELTEYFRLERHKSDAERVAPYEVVSTAWRRFASLDQGASPFASPRYWAAFVCDGV